MTLKSLPVSVSLQEKLYISIYNIVKHTAPPQSPSWFASHLSPIYPHRLHYLSPIRKDYVSNSPSDNCVCAVLCPTLTFLTFLAVQEHIEYRYFDCTSNYPNTHIWRYSKKKGCPWFSYGCVFKLSVCVYQQCKVKGITWYWFWHIYRKWSLNICSTQHYMWLEDVSFGSKDYRSLLFCLCSCPCKAWLRCKSPSVTLFLQPLTGHRAALPFLARPWM